MNDAAALSPRNVAPYATLPAWSILGVVSGYALAWTAIPRDAWWEAGALALPALLLSLGLLAGIAAAALRSSGALFRTEHILIFGLVYWVLLDPIQGSYSLFSVSEDGVQRSFLGIALFALFLWLGSTLMTAIRTLLREQVPGPGLDVGPRFLFGAACLCFLLGVLRILIGCQLVPGCIADYYFAPRFQGVQGWLGTFGDFDTLLIQIRFFGYLVLPIAAALYFVERRASWRVVIAVILGLAFLLLLIKGGGRRGVGTCLGATILVWILLREHISWRHLLMLGAAAVGLLLIMQAMLVWRTTGTLTAITQGESLEVKDRAGVIAVDKNFRILSQITTVIPERQAHTGVNGVVYMLTIFIPRSIFPGKPAGRGVDLMTLIDKKERPGWSWTCSSVCDLYLIGGNLAIAIGGMLYGFAANLTSRLLVRPPSVRSRLLFGILTMTLFVGLRSLHEVVSTGLAVLALWGVFGLRGMVVSRRRVLAPVRPPWGRQAS